MMKPGWIVVVEPSVFRAGFVLGPWRGWFSNFRARQWARGYLGRNPYGLCTIVPETTLVDIERTGRTLWDGRPLAAAIKEVERLMAETGRARVVEVSP